MSGQLIVWPVIFPLSINDIHNLPFGLAWFWPQMESRSDIILQFNKINKLWVFQLRNQITTTNLVQ